jgi:hypothetical protein
MLCGYWNKGRKHVEITRQIIAYLLHYNGYSLWENPMSEIDKEEEKTKDDEQVFEDHMDQEEEIAVGGSEAGRATNEMLRSLARTARSFLIYDTQNEAIKGFLNTYRKESTNAFENFGEMILEIRPFEMLRDGEVVYLERDRERSLAFRLFRDGVRKVTIQPAVQWEELLRLLEILSIRYTGINQQEEDIVTLLLKSGFQHIQISAVEGFVPDDEEYCADDISAAAARQVRTERRAKSHIEVPRDWDLPIPEPLQPKELSFVAISVETLTPIQQEGTSSALSDNTVALVKEMLRAVIDPVDPTGPGDVSGILSEARDFLLSEGQLGPLLDLLRSLDDILKNNPKRSKEVFESFISAGSVRKILMTIPRGSTKAPPELTELLDLVPIDHFQLLVELLETERGGTTRRVLKDLIQKYIGDDIQVGLEKIASSPSDIASDIFEALIKAKPEEKNKIAQFTLKRTERDLLSHALTILEELDDVQPFIQELHTTMHNNDPGVRMRSMKLLSKTKDIKLFRDLFEKTKKDNFSIKEAEVIGEVLFSLNPHAVFREMYDWIKPQGLFSFKKISIRKQQKWVAISALALIDKPEIEKTLTKLKKTAGEDISQLCIKALYKRRKHLGGS